MQNKQKQQERKTDRASYSKSNELPKKNILGIGVTDAPPEVILEYIVENLKKSQKPYYVVTPNPEMVVLASKNHEFRKVLNNAQIASNDGVGIGLAAHMLGNSLDERLTGVELVQKVCEKVADWPITVGFLGAEPNVAELVADCLKQKYPGLRVVLAQEELPETKIEHAAETGRYKKYTVSTMPSVDVLFVAFGAPKQEFWMADNIGKIDVKVMIGVGGAFDYISGKVARAPKVVRSVGMEWLFRLLVQPWRIKRQFALIEFVWMVMKEKFSSQLYQNIIL